MANSFKPIVDGVIANLGTRDNRTPEGYFGVCSFSDETVQHHLEAADLPPMDKTELYQAARLAAQYARHMMDENDIYTRAVDEAIRKLRP